MAEAKENSKKTRKPRTLTPKPMFIVYGQDDEGELVIYGATKDGGEALDLMDANEGAKYTRYMPPSKNPPQSMAAE